METLTKYKFHEKETHCHTGTRIRNNSVKFHSYSEKVDSLILNGNFL